MSRSYFGSFTLVARWWPAGDKLVAHSNNHASMLQQTPQAEKFKQQLRASLQDAPLKERALKLAKHAHVYTCGEQDATVYFVESGQVKLLMLSPEGRECLLAIHTAGDIFGELCLDRKSVV